MRKSFAALVMLLCFGTGPARAGSVIRSSAARNSAQDYRAGDGFVLRDVVVIILEGLADFREFRVRDPEDEADDFLNYVKDRESMDGVLRRRRFTRGVEGGVMAGTLPVQVEVVRSEEGDNFIALRPLR